MDRRTFLGALAAIPVAAVVQPKPAPVQWHSRTWGPLTFEGRPVKYDDHLLDAVRYFGPMHTTDTTRWTVEVQR